MKPDELKQALWSFLTAFHDEDIRNIADIPSNLVAVWYNYTLKNSEALFTFINAPAADGLYFEVTYDVERESVYIDTYKKVHHKEIPQ